MDELEELKNKHAHLKLVASCSTMFDEYLKIVEKTGIHLGFLQRIELYTFCAFVPYLTIMLQTNDEETKNAHQVSFLSTLLEYKPEHLTNKEFDFMLEAQEDGEESSTILDCIHAYYESWVDSIANETIEQDKRLIHAVSGIHIKLASRFACLSDEYQDLEGKRFDVMHEGETTEILSMLRQQSDLESSVFSKYMTQIQPLMKLTFGHLGEVSSISKDLS